MYRCKIVDCTEGQSKSSGKDMITVEYEIVSGEYKGRKFWDYITLTDEAAWKLRQFVDALGRKDKGTLDTNAVIGERVLVRAKHETDDRDPDNIVVRAKVGSVSSIPEEEDEEEPVRFYIFIVYIIIILVQHSLLLDNYRFVN